MSLYVGEHGQELININACAGTSLVSDMYSLYRGQPIEYKHQSTTAYKRKCKYCGTNTEKVDSRGNCINCGAPAD
jgi:hypothetical protein